MQQVFESAAAFTRAGCANAPDVEGKKAQTASNEDLHR